MGILDKLKGALKKPSSGSVEGIKLGQGIFSIEVLRIEPDRRGHIRKKWKRIATLEVSKETIDLAKPDGYAYVDKTEWPKIVDNYEIPELGGVFVRLRYFPNPQSPAGAKTIWTVFVSKDDAGEVSIDPEAEIPSIAELKTLFAPETLLHEIEVGAGAPRQAFNPYDPEAMKEAMKMAMQPLMMSMQMLSMMADAQEQFKQALMKLAGLSPEQERPKSKIELLREIVEELNQYEQLRKQLGGGSDLNDKLIEKMPWWALLLTQFTQTFSPFLQLLTNPMMMGMPGYGNPYQNPYGYPPQNQYNSYNNPYGGQPEQISAPPRERPRPPAPRERPKPPAPRERPKPPAPKKRPKPSWAEEPVEDSPKVEVKEPLEERAEAYSPEVEIDPDELEKKLKSLIEDVEKPVKAGDNAENEEVENDE